MDLKLHELCEVSIVDTNCKTNFVDIAKYCEQNQISIMDNSGDICVPGCILRSDERKIAWLFNNGNCNCDYEIIKGGNENELQ